jgi:hypothetical protein
MMYLDISLSQNAPERIVFVKLFISKLTRIFFDDFGYRNFVNICISWERLGQGPVLGTCDGPGPQKNSVISLCLPLKVQAFGKSRVIRGP